MVASSTASGISPHVDNDFRQQNIPAWMPILSPVYVISAFFALSVLLVPCGVALLSTARGVTEMSVQYDGAGTGDAAAGCRITAANHGYNSGATCTVRFAVERDLSAPVYVYYEIENFYQNHKKYLDSRDDDQLRGRGDGRRAVSSLASHPCAPLHELTHVSDNTTVYLNPCGFIANTLFNDVITLSNATGGDDGRSLGLTLREDKIAWKSDLEQKFGQVLGFRKERCGSCESPTCTCNDTQWSCTEPYADTDGTCWLYFYPDEDTTLYAYEIYPMVLNPVEGILNEHFLVWMRTAALPKFRKLYGYFADTDIPKGSVLEFQIQPNWAVDGFQGKKTLVLTESSYMGGRNEFVGWLYITVGAVCAVCGVSFGIVQLVAPRRLGDKAYLKKMD